jgi:hypothetical protein
MFFKNSELKLSVTLQKIKTDVFQIIFFAHSFGECYKVKCKYLVCHFFCNVLQQLTFFHMHFCEYCIQFFYIVRNFCSNTKF